MFSFYIWKMAGIYTASLSKALYNWCFLFNHSHTRTHTHSTAIGCRARHQNSSSGAIGGLFDIPSAVSKRQPSDCCSYLLSHCHSNTYREQFYFRSQFSVITLSQMIIFLPEPSVKRPVSPGAFFCHKRICQSTPRRCGIMNCQSNSPGSLWTEEKAIFLPSPLPPFCPLDKWKNNQWWWSERRLDSNALSQ